MHLESEFHEPPSAAEILIPRPPNRRLKKLFFFLVCEVNKKKYSERKDLVWTSAGGTIIILQVEYLVRRIG